MLDPQEAVAETHFVKGYIVVVLDKPGETVVILGDGVGEIVQGVVEGGGWVDQHVVVQFVIVVERRYRGFGYLFCCQQVDFLLNVDLVA